MKDRQRSCVPGTALLAGLVLFTTCAPPRKGPHEPPGRDGQKAETGQLLEQLKDPSPEKRAQAAKKLGKLNDPSVAPYLVQAFVDPHFLVPPAAHSALVSLGTNSIPALLDGLKSGNVGLWMGCSLALQTIGEPAVQPMIQFWIDANLHDRSKVEFTLERMGIDLKAYLKKRVQQREGHE